MKELHLNTTTQPERVLRAAELLSILSCAKSKLHKDVKDRVMTAPIRPSHRMAFWPESEVRIIQAARIAGKTPDELRAIVEQLHAKRQADAANLLPQG